VVLSSTTVTFVVSKGNESYSLRDLTNYTLKSVQDYASDLGLKLQINKEYNDTVANDMVITQQPSAGSDISEGDTLTVTISQGKDPAKEDQDDQDSYTSFTISVNVPFQPTANQTSNKIQVYIEDKDHSLSNVYQSFDITNDTSITIPFVLEGNKAGKYKIYRDGQLVAQNDNVKN
jgi:beta-lactam-binding protein with PASTA domain